MTFFSRSFCVLFSAVLKHRPEELSMHAHTSGMMRWRLLRLGLAYIPPQRVNGSI